MVLRRPRPLVPFLALSAVLGACGGGAGTTPSSAAIATSTAAASEAPTPDASPSAATSTATAAPVATWTLADIPGEERIVPSVTRVARHADGYIAIGQRQCTWSTTDPSDVTACHGLAWLSDTGETWTRVEPSAAIDVGVAFPTSGPEVGWVSVDGGALGTVLAGYRLNTAPSGPTVWFLDERGTFTRLPPDPAFAGARWGGVLATDDGFLIVGTVVDGTEPRGAAWWSDDGINWVRAEDGPWFDVGGFYDTLEAPTFGGPVAAAATATGFVAVGSVCGPDGTGCVGAAWSSPDGLSWDRLEVPAVDGGFADVTTVPAGIVAVAPALGEGRVGHVLVGSDAAGWEVVPVAGTAQPGAVATTGDGVIAVGAATGAPPVAWSSPDGLTWTAVDGLPQIPGLAMTDALDVVADHGRIVIAGWAETDGAPGTTGFAMIAEDAP